MREKMISKVEALRNRIVDLHKEIKYRDNRIEELEQELLVKDEIIRKQVIMLSKSSTSDVKSSTCPK